MARFTIGLLLCVLLALPVPIQAQVLPIVPVDPGVRGGRADAGGPIPGLSADEQRFFESTSDTFAEVDGVDEGLGPRFNLDGCAGCHAQPGIGGTSPSTNPEIAAANDLIFRIPTPVFGGGLIEAIPDSAIRANAKADSDQKSAPRTSHSRSSPARRTTSNKA
jgi:CxxC motif-containing protein (DUF1111 family)